jgi:hypothetical protein
LLIFCWCKFCANLKKNSRSLAAASEERIILSVLLCSRLKKGM